ncbi:MAG TPA: SMP-30/gluconolactonase/LRE family protein [Nocardioidaceae bacterium]|nr:SMP-30/gluconolactonase/LRE family protein [Nocardioidaceae bacterium]
MDKLTVLPVPGFGAEDVVVDDSGVAYTGTEDGSVFALAAGGRRIDLVARTGGRPLGLELLGDGRLLVCDGNRGLLAVRPDGHRDGRPDVLVGTVHGRRMRFCNNAAVQGNGDIWFTDSSRFYGVDQWAAELVEDTRSGRLLRRSADGAVEVVLSGLRFGNGVALAADESFVAVAETAARRVVRHWLSGPSAGTTDTLAGDLPGYPDNISRGSDGLVWVALASPTDPVVERVMRAPMLLRRVAWRLPETVRPKPKRTVRVLALAADGSVVHDRGLPGDGFHMVTGVREHHGRVWLSSLNQAAVAHFDL